VARTNATNFTGPLQFPYANAGTDIFKKEDVQTLAQAVDQHDHTTGKGLPMAAGSIPNGTITSAMIADGTIQGADIATGAITTTQIADGTIATADLANAAVTNAKLGTDTARLNLLTNGGFEIWQRGNGPFSGSTQFTADRWQSQPGGGSTLSVSKDTTNQDAASQACAALTYTHSAFTTMINPFAYANDGGLIYQLRGKTISFSIRVRTSTPNAVRAGVFGSILGRVQGTLHTGDGTYQLLTTTVTVPSNETNLQAEIQLNASCTAYVDNAMLVVGSVAADYAPLHPADDLARCLRYYEVLLPSGNAVFQGYAASVSSTYWYTPFKTIKAVSPTTTKIGTWQLNNVSSQPTVFGTDTGGVTFQATNTAAGMLQVQSPATGGGLTSEANP